MLSSTTGRTIAPARNTSSCVAHYYVPHPLPGSTTLSSTVCATVSVRRAHSAGFTVVGQHFHACANKFAVFPPESSCAKPCALEAGTQVRATDWALWRVYPCTVCACQCLWRSRALAVALCGTHVACVRPVHALQLQPCSAREAPWRPLPRRTRCGCATTTTSVGLWCSTGTPSASLRPCCRLPSTKMLASSEAPRPTAPRWCPWLSCALTPRSR